MAREISAGGVVIRRMEDRWHFAAIEPEGRNSGKKDVPVLALPKGIVDRGEKPEQTAVREVREETGVEAALVTKLDDIKYQYVRSWGDHARVFKIVSFYLLLYRSGRLGEIAPEMRKEVKSARWVPLEEAKRLAYRGERDMVQRALEYVNSHPEI
jgi:8-oxo-dGTP pyrophosphatase MutT (NUDIX family)